MDCCNNPCGQSLEVEEAECQARHVMTDNITTWAILWMVISKHPKTMNVNFYHPISMIELMEPLKETLKALNISSIVQHYGHFQWPKDPNSWWITRTFFSHATSFPPLSRTTRPSLQGTQLGIQKLREILVGFHWITVIHQVKYHDPTEKLWQPWITHRCFRLYMLLYVILLYIYWWYIIISS